MAHHFGQVGQGQPAADRVDAYGPLPDAGGRGQVESGAHQAAGFCFLRGGDAVLEVVGDAVDGEHSGLVEHALRGAGDWLRTAGG